MDDNNQPRGHVLSGKSCEEGRQEGEGKTDETWVSQGQNAAPSHSVCGIKLLLKGFSFYGRGQPLKFYFPFSQKSFYDASYDPLPKNCVGQFLSLSTSETSKTSQLTYKESVVVVAANGKILKKRRLSFNQFITDDDLEAIANDPEEGRESSSIISLFSIFKQM